jgi:hypothetical protein
MPQVMRYNKPIREYLAKEAQEWEGGKYAHAYPFSP